MKTVALSMIVRDAAATLSGCLQSVQGVVDEIHVADTGSVDDTICIAQSYSARVSSIPWANDFAKARNHALQNVKTDWVLSLDADEQLDPTTAKNLRSCLVNDSIAGYQITIRNYVLSLEDRLWDRPAKPNDTSLSAARHFPAYVEHENVRLFRRDADIYFIGRVHESVGPRILELGRHLGQGDFLIHHFGLAADQETRARKNLFYRELGYQKIAEMPANAQAHLELGLVEFDNFANYDEAYALFAKACQLNPRFGIAWFFQGLTLVRLNRFTEALKCLAEAEHRGQRTAVLAEVRGDAYYNAGRFAEASQSFEMSLRREPKNALVESKLGLALVRSGDSGRGLKILQSALASNPSTAALHDRLIQAYVWQDRLQEAASVATAKLKSIASPPATDFLRAASLWAKLDDWPVTIQTLRSGLLNHPRNSDLNQGLQEAIQRSQIHQSTTTVKSMC